jgi:hypothetical protein
MPVPIAVAILMGVLDGLHAAHEARSEDGQPLEIVHRDVSPQNVLIGVDGLPRILDFGIAKAVGRMQTTRGDQLKGKLAYMAPEHLGREALDRRADIYAAGILLWELVTGERLFQADDEISTFRRALEAKVEPPSNVRPELPPALDAIVLSALAKTPSQRFQTARDFSYELEKTSLAASTRDLAAWLQTTAAESLRERAERLARYEAAHEAARDFTTTDADSSPSAVFPAALAARLREGDAPTAMLEPVTRPKPTRPTAWLVALPLALLLGTFVVSRLMRAPGVPTSIAEAPAPVARAPVTPGSSATLATVTTAPSAAAAPPAPSAPRQAGSRSAAPKKRGKTGCETAFTVDAQGVRVPKLECL